MQLATNFDLNTLKEIPRSIMVISKRATPLVQTLMKHVPTTHNYIFDANNRYIDVQGSKTIIDVVNDQALGNIVNSNGKQEVQVIIDNALCSQPLCSMPNFKRLVMDNKRLKIGTIIVVPMSIFPYIVNEHIEVVFIFKDTNINMTGIMKIYENHCAKAFPTFQRFSEIYSSLDANTCLVIENDNKAYKYKL